MPASQLLTAQPCSPGSGVLPQRWSMACARRGQELPLPCHLCVCKSPVTEDTSPNGKGKFIKQEGTMVLWRTVLLDPATHLVRAWKRFHSLGQKERPKLLSSTGERGCAATARLSPPASIRGRGCLPPFGCDVFVRWGTIKELFLIAVRPMFSFLKVK